MVEFEGVEPDALEVWAADALALVAAAEFLKERAAEEGEIRRRVDLLDHLLNGVVPPAAGTLRHLRPPLGIAVGTLRLPSDTNSDGAVRLLRALLAFTQEAGDHARAAAVVTSRDKRAILLWPQNSMAVVERMTRELQVAAGRLQQMAPGAAVTYAIAEPISGLDELAIAYEEARVATDVRVQLGREDQVFSVQTLGVYRLIIQAAKGSDVVAFCRQTLKGVMDEAVPGRRKLLETYSNYLKHDQSVKATAAALSVHPHTVQYRLDRLQQLTGLSIRRPEDRLTLELAVRILQLAGELAN
jgi:hypothetical protein